MKKIVMVCVLMVLVSCEVKVWNDDVLTVRSVRQCAKEDVKYEYTIKCDDVTTITWRTNTPLMVGDTVAIVKAGQ